MDWNDRNHVGEVIAKVGSVSQAVKPAESSDFQRIQHALIQDPDDRHLARQFNRLRVHRRREIGDRSLKILLGPCSSTSLLRDSICPWATVVSFNFEDPGNRAADHIAVSFEDCDMVSILDLVPDGFETELVLLLQPEFSRIPRNISQSRVPVVLYVQDHHRGIPKLVALSDMVAGAACWDRDGVESLSSIGLRTFFAPGNGYEPASHKGDAEAARPVDVAFLGGMDRAGLFPTYLERDRMVVELAKLHGEVDMLISDKLDDSLMGPNYLEALRSSKIIVCHTETRRLHPSVCEGMAAGAAVMLNRGNAELERKYVDGESIVYYSRHDLLEKVRWLLADAPRRVEIARNGQNLITQTGTFARLAGAAIDAISRKRDVWLGAVGTAENLDLRSGILAVFNQSLPLAGQHFENALAFAPGDSHVAMNNLGVIEVLQAASHPMGDRPHIYARAESRFAEATGTKWNRPVPIYHLCILEWLMGRPPPVHLIEHLGRMLTNPTDDSISRFELVLAPEMTTAVAYQNRQSRFFSEWSDLVVQTAGRDLAARFCQIACWQAWGLRRDMLVKSGRKPEAIIAAKKSHGYFPDDPNAAFKYGELAVESADFESARRALEAAIKNRPLHSEARVLYGAVLDALGLKQALAELTVESEPLFKIAGAWANSPSARD